MSSKDYNSEMERQLEAAFKSQDPDLLDVVFEIDGKKIYADKLRLSFNSSIFKSMLSDSWNKTIEISDFSFADFKEFLKFIHSGKCNITNENIFVMVDIAEFYQSEHFKCFCNEYLSKMKFDLTNIFQLLHIYNKYSMNHLKKPIHDFIIQNFSTFVQLKEFMNGERFVIKEIVTLKPNVIVKPKEIFQAVFQWGEYQAQLKREVQLSNQNLNMNDAIKAEITEFLPFIEFKNMKLHFLTDYVVKRGFLFSYEELSEILNCVSIVIPNNYIKQDFIVTCLSGRLDKLCELLKAEADKTNGKIRRTLVFLNTKRMSDMATLYLCQRGIPATCLSSDRGQHFYEQVLSEFRSRRVSVLVCTDVSASGIDFEELDHVINLDLPNTAAMYFQRVRRAGRINPGYSTTFVEGTEPLLKEIAEMLAKSEEPIPKALESLLLIS